ncbi:MAG: hypothetical protein D6714_09325 [Bacteroidetes bacterium]|nr:MAG: hypothetical protein D6714_09325 [Bacteroidota bacterium]
MIQRDYVQRMIEDLARVIAQLSGMNPPAGLDFLDQSMETYLKLEAGEVDALSEAALLKTLHEEKGLHVGQLEFLAELLARQGELLFAQNDFEPAGSKFRKALIIFDFVEKELALFSIDRHQTIQKTKAFLATINTTKK